MISRPNDFTRGCFTNIVFVHQFNYSLRIILLKNFPNALLPKRFRMKHWVLDSMLRASHNSYDLKNTLYILTYFKTITFTFKDVAKIWPIECWSTLWHQFWRQSLWQAPQLVTGSGGSRRVHQTCPNQIYKTLFSRPVYIYAWFYTFDKYIKN